MIFGILTILLGCLAGLFVLLMLVQVVASRAGQVPATSASAILPAVTIYVGLAVGLIWLGIGSCMARRWARALLLIFSWCWLVIGLLVVVFMAFFIPKILANLPASGTAGQPAMPPAALGAVMVILFLVFSVIFVVMPAIWTFFYHSRHVKATCEARDPLTRWTDACPLPVLAFSLWLMFSVLMILLMPVVGHGVMPFFGTFVSGLPGTLVCLAVAAVWGYAAWLLYRLDVRGWWLIMIALVVFLASSLLTYARHDVLEMYHLMGYPEAQIEQIQKTGLLTGNRMILLMLFSFLPFLGFLCFIKKYLHGKS
jgi:hypothetical protein